MDAPIKHNEFPERIRPSSALKINKKGKQMTFEQIKEQIELLVELAYRTGEIDALKSLREKDKKKEEDEKENK